jgi:hypothetical protein
MHIHSAWSVISNEGSNPLDLQRVVPGRTEAQYLEGRWWQGLTWLSPGPFQSENDRQYSQWQLNPPFRTAIYAASAESIPILGIPSDANIVGVASPFPAENLSLLLHSIGDSYRMPIDVTLDVESVDQAGKLLAVRWVDSNLPVEHLDTLLTDEVSPSYLLPRRPERILGMTVQVETGHVINVFPRAESELGPSLYVLDADVTEIMDAVRPIASALWSHR